jgi:hypothetical protein
MCQRDLVLLRKRPFFWMLHVDAPLLMMVMVMVMVMVKVMLMVSLYRAMLF